MRERVYVAKIMPLLLVVFAAACDGPPQEAGPVEQEGGLVGELGAETAFTAWIGRWEASAMGAAPLEGGGWLVACTGYEPRGYGYALLAGVAMDGEVEWTREFRGRDLEVSDLIMTEDGHYILAGSDSPTWDDEQIVMMDLPEGEGFEALSWSGPSADYWAVKVNAQGEMLWQADLNTSADEFCSSVMELPGGDLAFAGTRFLEGGTPLFRLVRTRADGSIVWDYTYGFPEGQLCDQALMTPGGSFLLGGTINSISTDAGILALVLVDADGTETWLRKYEDEGSNHLHAFTLTAEGNIAAVGRRRTGNGADQAFLKLLSPEGEERWTELYPFEGFHAVTVTDEGGFIVAGVEGLQGLGSQGEVLWTMYLSDIRVQSVRGVHPLEEGRFLVFGAALPPRDAGVESEGALGFLRLLGR